MSKFTWKLVVLFCLMLMVVLLVGGCEEDDDKPGENRKTDSDKITATDSDTIDTASDTATTTPMAECHGEMNTAKTMCIVSGVLTGATHHWTKAYTYVLRGGVFVGDDVNETVLTIDPGVTVLGEVSTKGMLVVTRGSKIMAAGTVTEPIVFTSSNPVGSRARGDWGGLIINGRATINGCDTPPCEASGEGGTGWYGGTNDDDNSGILQYVRVEFAGRLISEDNELNGIAFQGVGRGTVVDNVQVHMNADDGVEFFGGTVSVKHVYLTGIGDDCLDWTDGWRGYAQYILAVQSPDAGDQGIEADNNAENNALTPIANPILSNVTLLGSGGENSDIGMLLREGTKATIHNTIVANFADGCIDMDGDTITHAANGEVIINNSIVNCTVNFMEGGDEVPATVVSDTWNAGTGNQIGNALAGIYSTGIAIGTGAAPANAFFDQVNYVGAVTQEADWTAGWTTTAPN
ncbi:MAG: hypothetical protein JXR76_32170 [Deltaproteobacteria bacterium]|nr:hypothetical protein [Deltaproteobacteria bacterium]